MIIKIIYFVVFKICLDFLVILLVIFIFLVSVIVQFGSLSCSKICSDFIYLEKAMACWYIDLQEVICLFNCSLQESLGMQDYWQSVWAYVFLGQIYEDIGQAFLAFNCYQQVMLFWNMLANFFEQVAN